MFTCVEHAHVPNFYSFTIGKVVVHWEQRRREEGEPGRKTVFWLFYYYHRIEWIERIEKCARCNVIFQLVRSEMENLERILIEARTQIQGLEAAAWTNQEPLQPQLSLGTRYILHFGYFIVFHNASWWTLFFQFYLFINFSWIFTIYLQ